MMFLIGIAVLALCVAVLIAIPVLVGGARLTARLWPAPVEEPDPLVLAVSNGWIDVETARMTLDLRR